MSHDKAVFNKSTNYIQHKIEDILDAVSPTDIKNVKKLFSESKRIFVYGAGRSGLVAKAFAMRLMHLGFQTFVIGETITGPVQNNDLVIIVSGSGETIPAVMTAEIAHNLSAKVVSITGKKNSGIAKFADVTVFISSFCKDAERKKYAPLGTLFEISVWLIFDGIIADLMDSKNETEEIMSSRHSTLEQ
ncbi:MAG: 6-phospho-3-hexuloisomerase [Candidatus Asgardarchaeum californiense]|nr:MAG: 6-phospho-3-hexuloisomerase [Candidatus Asgardarchaeum californiense]